MGIKTPQAPEVQPHVAKKQSSSRIASGIDPVSFKTPDDQPMIHQVEESPQELTPVPIIPQVPDAPSQQEPLMVIQPLTTPPVPDVPSQQEPLMVIQPLTTPPVPDAPSQQEPLMVIQPPTTPQVPDAPSQQQPPTIVQQSISQPAAPQVPDAPLQQQHLAVVQQPTTPQVGDTPTKHQPPHIVLPSTLPQIGDALQQSPITIQQSTIQQNLIEPNFTSQPMNSLPYEQPMLSFANEQHLAFQPNDLNFTNSNQEQYGYGLNFNFTNMLELGGGLQDNQSTNYSGNANFDIPVHSNGLWPTASGVGMMDLFNNAIGNPGLQLDGGAWPGVLSTSSSTSNSTTYGMGSTNLQSISQGNSFQYRLPDSPIKPSHDDKTLDSGQNLTANVAPAVLNTKRGQLKVNKGEEDMQEDLGVQTQRPAGSKEIVPLTQKVQSKPDANALPDWLEEATAYLKEKVDDSVWVECVDTWIAFEKANGLWDSTAVSSYLGSPAHIY